VGIQPKSGCDFPNSNTDDSLIIQRTDASIKIKIKVEATSRTAGQGGDFDGQPCRDSRDVNIRWRELPGITPHGPSDGENLPALLATANAAAAVPARARPALASAWSSLYVGPASNLSTSSRRHHEPPRSLGFIHPRPHIYNRRVIAFGFPDQHSRRGARWSSSSGVRSYTPSPLPRGTARR
jgi:hypothetical protein